MSDELVQVTGNCADVFCNAPFVVVEDGNELFGCLRDVIHRFKRNTVGGGSVANDGDDIFITSALVASCGDSKGCGQRGAGVGGSVAIVIALRAHGETTQPSCAANGVKLIFAAG